MNEILANQLEALDTALDAFEDADSDKRWNRAREAVMKRWNEVIYWLDYDDDEYYCECCGGVLFDSDRDIYGEFGDYCSGCTDEMEADEDEY